jgi:hypothetical protein
MVAGGGQAGVGFEIQPSIKSLPPARSRPEGRSGQRSAAFVAATCGFGVTSGRSRELSPMRGTHRGISYACGFAGRLSRPESEPGCAYRRTQNRAQTTGRSLIEGPLRRFGPPGESDQTSAGSSGSNSGCSCDRRASSQIGAAETAAFTTPITIPSGLMDDAWWPQGSGRAGDEGHPRPLPGFIGFLRSLPVTARRLF